MPFTRPQAAFRRRILINGEPNVRKTSVAIHTTPKPVGVISMPGEKGYASIPTNDPEIIPFVWEMGADHKMDSAAIVNEVFKVSMEMIGGKYGVINTFVSDGLHKLIGYVLDEATNGAWFSGEEVEPKLYAVAYRRFEDYISRIYHSPIPVAVFTLWDGETPDRKKRKGEASQDVPTSTRPKLPGQLALQIMGEFNYIFHQTLRAPKPGEAPIAMWQTRPLGLIKGASIKGPADVTSLFPDYIVADYRVFEATWVAAEKAAAQKREAGNAK